MNEPINDDRFDFDSVASYSAGDECQKHMFDEKRVKKLIKLCYKYDIKVFPLVHILFRTFIFDDSMLIYIPNWLNNLKGPHVPSKNFDYIFNKYRQKWNFEYSTEYRDIEKIDKQIHICKHAKHYVENMGQDNLKRYITDIEREIQKLTEMKLQKIEDYNNKISRLQEYSKKIVEFYTNIYTRPITDTYLSVSIDLEIEALLYKIHLKT